MKKLTLTVLIGLSPICCLAADANSTPPCQWVAATGTVFTCDTSNPALGKAFRDPSGRIWSSIARFDSGEVRYMQLQYAENYCKEKGARLPTTGEYGQLAQYLGDGSRNWNSPFASNSQYDWYWTSSYFSNGSDNIDYGRFAALPNAGGGAYTKHDSDYWAVLCVSL